MAAALCFFPLLMCLASVQAMQVKFRDCGELFLYSYFGRPHMA